MRLIDADELGYTLTEGLKCELCINPMHTDRGCDGNCMIPNQLLLNAMCKYIADGVNNQKTVDAALVRHGHWEMNLDSDEAWVLNRYRKCSVCGVSGFHGEYKYCQHCGAMMDG